MAPPNSNKASRFTSEFSEHALIRIVRKVLLKAGVRWMSKESYDQQRPPGTPTARAILARFAPVDWQAFCLLVTDTTRNAEHILAIWRRRPEREKLTEREVVAALRLVADWLGVKTLRPGAYDEARARLIAENRRAWAHGPDLELVLPTSAQIQNSFDWDEALELADLATREHATLGGMPVPEALELFYGELGSLPRGYVQLVEYGRRKGFAVVKVRAPDSYPVFFAEFLKQRGLPDDAPRCQQLPEHLEPVTGATPPRRYRWDDADQLIRGVAKAIDQLQPGEKLTFQKLLAIAKGNPEIPAPSTVIRFAKVSDRFPGKQPLQEVRAAAVELLERERRAGGVPSA